MMLFGITKRTAWAVLAALLAYLISYTVIFHYTGRGMSIAAVIPVATVGWFFGMIPGLCAGILSLPLNIGMYTLYGMDWLEKLFVHGAGIQGTVSLIIVGTIVGRISDVRTQLNKHREQLNGLVKKRTAALTLANEQLKAREQELRAINQQLMASEQQLRAGNQQLITSESELRNSKEFLEKVFEATADGIMVTDSRGRILKINRALAQMLRCEAHELQGKYTAELTPENDVLIKKRQEVFEELFEKGYIEHWETEWYRKDGTLCPVEINITLQKDPEGNVTSAVGAIRDSSERKQAEKELIRLGSAVGQASELIKILDADGTIQYINPAAEKTMGYSQEELLGRKVFPPQQDSPDKLLNLEIWQTIKQGKLWSGHQRNVKKDGTIIELESTVSPIRDAEGKIINYLAVSRDVTNELKLERQLRQTQKMEAIGTLAGGIAHDFNNILAAILGYAEMVYYGKSTGASDIHNYLKKILDAGNRAKDLVNQILTFSRQREQEHKPVKTSPLIKEALKLLRSTLPANIGITQSINTSADTIFADPTQIHQIIMNLCTNAAYAMRPGGGTLAVSLEDVYIDADSENQVPDVSAGEYLVLSVSDTGSGMEPAVIERIFDPFFTTKEAGEGTGMGLSVVHGIVKTHGGVITVESSPEKGSTFKVLLPKIEDQVSAEPVATTHVPRGNERILFVDDEEALMEITKIMLTALGYDVIARTSSIEALEAFRAGPDKFDLVITDQAMPNLTGIELSKELIQLRPDIPIILCTGFSETVSPEKAQTLGIRELILKPISRDQLAITVRKVLTKE